MACACEVSGGYIYLSVKATTDCDSRGDSRVVMSEGKARKLEPAGGRR